MRRASGRTLDPWRSARTVRVRVARPRGLVWRAWSVDCVCIPTGGCRLAIRTIVAWSGRVRACAVDRLACIPSRRERSRSALCGYGGRLLRSLADVVAELASLASPAPPSGGIARGGRVAAYPAERKRQSERR